jgi:predicted XRE-type DNA-binding protein
MDWKKLISQLVESGLTQVEIAKSVECGQTTISELFRGETEDPRSSVGLALIALAKKRGIAVTEVA